jgi:membrane protein DedA with SNARE-associated domain
MKMLKFLLSTIIMLSGFLASAQIQMADDFRGEGKIYVVLAIILVILAGFFFLLFKLDRRSKRLEKEINQK